MSAASEKTNPVAAANEPATEQEKVPAAVSAEHARSAAAGRAASAGRIVLRFLVHFVSAFIPGGSLLRDQYESAVRERNRAAPNTLEGQIDDAASQLASAARSFHRIEEEVERRQAAVAELQSKAATAECLSALHQDQLLAVKDVLRDEFSNSERRTFQQSLYLTIGSFLAGVLVTVLVTLVFG